MMVPVAAMLPPDEAAEKETNPKMTTTKTKTKNPSTDQWIDDLCREFAARNLGQDRGQSVKPILAPALISEKQGLRFVTHLLAVRDENGMLSSEFLASDLPQNLQNLELKMPQPESQIPMAAAAGINEEYSTNQSDESDRLSMQEPPLQTENQSRNAEKNAEQFQAEATTTTTTPTPTLETENQRMTNGQSENLSRQPRNFGNPPNSMQNEFYNPSKPLSYTALDWQRFRQQNPHISRHKKIISKFGRNPVIARRLYSNLFADTIHAYKNDEIAAQNDGYKYIMVLICGLSRRLQALPMKRLTAENGVLVLEKMFKRLSERRGHSWFETDQGPEFSDHILPLLERFQMTPAKLQGEHKASIAERVMYFYKIYNFFITYLVVLYRNAWSDFLRRMTANSAGWTIFLVLLKIIIILFIRLLKWRQTKSPSKMKI